MIAATGAKTHRAPRAHGEEQFVASETRGIVRGCDVWQDGDVVRRDVLKEDGLCMYIGPSGSMGMIHEVVKIGQNVSPIVLGVF